MRSKVSDPPRTDLEQERVFARVAKAMLGEDVEAPTVGRYELRERLGSGGMGEVYAAWDPEQRCEVAIKVVKRQRETDPGSVQRLRKEGRALQRLEHPNVVRVVEVGEDGDRFFIAMERLEGESLDAILEREGRLSPARTLAILSDVCAALEAAHAAGIVHRDLKPGNVFVDRDGRAKVLDFGVAKGLSTATLGGTTASGTVFGTPFYMSPEQARDATKVDRRADLWAVAIIAYECIVGRRPFDADNLPDLAVQILTEKPPVPSEHGEVPAGFDPWFSRATDPDPQRRMQSADAVAASLAAVVSGATVSGWSASRVAALIIALGLLLALAWWFWR